MSIEVAERYIQELEAIKNYPQVKREREEFSHEVERLKAQLENALQEVASLRSVKANLDTAEMTLEEARLDFIRAMNTEIEKRAADRFEKLKADYESKLPQLVYQRLRNILRQPRWPEKIAKLIDTEAKQKADAILRNQNSWPQWFKELYQEEVKKKVRVGLDQEFNARVETAAVSRAQQRLNELINIEWPAWRQAHIEPKIVALESKLSAGALQLLKGPWVFTCDRCGTRFDNELTSFGIERLLKKGEVHIQCPACENHSLFSRRRHTFTVSLHELIEFYLSAGS